MHCLLSQIVVHLVTICLRFELFMTLLIKSQTVTIQMKATEHIFLSVILAFIMLFRVVQTFHSTELLNCDLSK